MNPGPVLATGFGIFSSTSLGESMKALIAVCTASLLSGCGIVLPAKHNSGDLDKLTAGMTEQQVDQVLDSHYVTLHEGETAEGRNTVVRLYDLYGRNTAVRNLLLGLPTFTVTWWLVPDTKAYELVFVDHKLQRWALDEPD
jgi:hypothetical protein